MSQPRTLKSDTLLSPWQNGSLQIVAVVAVLIAISGYVWWTIRAERNVLRQQSLNRVQGLAEVVSRQIDGQCEAIRSIVTDVVRRELSTRMSRIDATRQVELERDLSEVLHSAYRLVPASSSLELYNFRGKMLARYRPANKNPVTIADGAIPRTIDGLRTSGGALSFHWIADSPNGFAVAVPLDAAAFDGVLVISYRSQLLDEWVQATKSSADFAVYLVDGRGRTAHVRNSIDDKSAQDLGDRFSEMREPGADEIALADSPELFLIGYASAQVPRWTVVVAQPSRTALVTINRLADSVALLAVTLTLFGAIIGWKIGHRPSPPGPKPSVGSGTKAAGNKRGDVDVVTAPPIPSSSGGFFIATVAWKVAATSVRGTSHAKTGRPCQDSSYCQVVNDNILLGAVADGAGSAPDSDKGAQVAAKLAVEALAAHVASIEPTATDQQWIDLLLAAMRVAQGHVEVNAAARNKPVRQLATTLILFAALRDLIVTTQIGDGAVVVRDTAGTMHSLTVPQHGEYVNTTTFLVSPNAFQSVQHRIWRGPYRDIAAFSDGLQMLALNMPKGVPHAPFFQPLFDFVRESTGEDAVRELGSFLSSKRITDRADDDLTLALATVMR